MILTTINNDRKAPHRSSWKWVERSEDVFEDVFLYYIESRIQKWLEMGLASLNPFPATSVRDLDNN